MEFPGNLTNWDSGGSLNELGFTTGTRLQVDYNKLELAKTRGYYNITTDANITIPFKIKYDAYAINNTDQVIPDSLPNNYNPQVFLITQNSNLLIYSGSNSSTATLSMNLFFPLSTITSKACDSGTLEVGDTNTTTSESTGDIIKLDWSLTQGDLDCINITMASPSQLIFIRDMSLTNTVMGKSFPIYLYNSTILNSEFGSSGDLDKEKCFCEVERVGLLVNNDEYIPTKFEVISWR